MVKSEVRLAIYRQLYWCIGVSCRTCQKLFKGIEHYKETVRKNQGENDDAIGKHLVYRQPLLYDAQVVNK